MKILAIFVLLAVAITAARVETHFYSSPNSECGVTTESSRYFFYETGTCYVNRTLTGILDCTSQITCLDQQLEWDDLESCYAAEINATLGDFGGSFQITSDESGHYREQFATSDCTGNSDRIELVDNCELNSCSGDLARLQRFPQRLAETSASAEADDDDDDDSLNTRGIIGISILSAIVLIGMVCLACCCLALVVVFVLMVIFAGVTIFFLITTVIRYRNEMAEDADEEKAVAKRAAKEEVEEDAEEDVKEDDVKEEEVKEDDVNEDELEEL